MEVPDDEGVVNHTGSESCVYTRKGISEVLIGEVRTGLLSRERCGKLRGADVVHKTEGNTGCIARRDVVGPRVVKEPEQVHKLLAREPGGPMFDLDEGPR
jgi:hypothetical protein